MPRSSYIYTVQDASSGNVLAAFTVKHELVTWLLGNRALYMALHVMRVPDGGAEGRNVGLSIRDLLGDA